MAHNDHADRVRTHTLEAKADALLAAGFRKSLDAYFYTLDRSGAHRYRANLERRYVELRSILARRNVRSTAGFHEQ